MTAANATPPRVLTDATPFIQGLNLWSTHRVATEYALILDRVTAEALERGELTDEQLQSSVPGAFATPDDCLFLCHYLPGDPPRVFGTSVPRGSWWVSG